MTSSDKFRALLAQRPDDAWLLFTDACVDPRSGAVGLGGALFNPRGQSVLTWSERSTVWTRDTTVAELLALRAGAQRAHDHGVARLLAVADCQPAVEALNGNDGACTKSLDLVEHVRGTFRRFDAWVCAWSPRHRLSVPNDLARASIGKPPENRQAVTAVDLSPWLTFPTEPLSPAESLQKAFAEHRSNRPHHRPS